MMVEVVNSGTGTAAALPDVQVAGKTGTAELGTVCDDGAAPVPRARSPSRTSTPGSPPSRPPTKPKLAVAVLVVNADGDGGTIAAPIARQILMPPLGRRVGSSRRPGRDAADQREQAAEPRWRRDERADDESTAPLRAGDHQPPPGPAAGARGRCRADRARPTSRGRAEEPSITRRPGRGQGSRSPVVRRGHRAGPRGRARSRRPRRGRDLELQRPVLGRRLLEREEDQRALDRPVAAASRAGTARRAIGARHEREVVVEPLLDEDVAAGVDDLERDRARRWPRRPRS